MRQVNYTEKRQCKFCGKEFVISNPRQLYCAIHSGDQGYYARNKMKINQRNLSNYYNKREQMLSQRKEHRLLNLYGLTPEKWTKEFEKQGKCCAVCKIDIPGNGRKTWATDHDHVTKKFRGILCHACNWALGQAKDDPRILRALAEYLERNL